MPKRFMTSAAIFSRNRVNRLEAQTKIQKANNERMNFGYFAPERTITREKVGWW
jgi:hypothetical protein